MFPSKFLQFPSILTHSHAANEKIQNGGRDLAISRGLVWAKMPHEILDSEPFPSTGYCYAAMMVPHPTHPKFMIYFIMYKTNNIWWITEHTTIVR